MVSPRYPTAHMKPIVPRMSEEQLNGLLHSSYTFKDSSWISRRLFRPFWQMVSNRFPTNVAPMFLMGFGNFLTIFNVLLLTWCDPDFNTVTSSRWIYVLSAICQIVSFTCSGVDAAGRFHRRVQHNESTSNPVANPFSSAEYVERCFESLMLCAKTVCFLHVIGIDHGNLSYFSAYLLVIVILACFLCQQWEAYVTTVYKTSLFLDSAELVLLIGFVGKISSGQNFDWKALKRIQCMGYSLTVIFAGVFFAGAAVSVLKSWYRGVTQSGPSAGKSPLLPFLIFSAAQFMWIFSVSGYQDRRTIATVFPFLCWSTALVSSSLVTELIMRQISRNEERDRFSSSAIAVLIIFSSLNFLGVLSSLRTIRTAWLSICCILSIWHGITAVRAAKDVIYRVFLAVAESFFRRAGHALAPYWNKLKNDNRYR